MDDASPDCLYLRGKWVSCMIEGLRGTHELASLVQ